MWTSLYKAIKFLEGKESKRMNRRRQEKNEKDGTKRNIKGK